MKSTIQITLALLALSFIAGCANKSHDTCCGGTGGKTYVPAKVK
jgi:hypothetical protein